MQAKLAWEEVEDIKNIKLTPRFMPSKLVNNAILTKAISKAEIVTEWWGIASIQAKLAWEEVEDIASNDMTEAMKGAIASGETLTACEAMEELERALFVEEKVMKENDSYE